MRFYSWSISKKILLGILPLFFLFIAMSVALNNRFQEREMMEQAQLAAHTYADIIKESLVNMMVTNYEVNESFLDSVSALPQFDSLRLVINELRLRKEILEDMKPKTQMQRHKTVGPRDTIQKQVTRSGEAHFLLSGDSFRGVIPFKTTKVCQKCHAAPLGYVLGAVDLNISLSRMSLAARENWHRSFLIFIAFSIVAILLAGVMFSRFVSRPVEQLVRATTAISAGNLEIPLTPGSRREQEGSRDELDFLSVKFEAMRESLKHKIAELDEANKSLAERNSAVEHALASLNQAQEELVKSERLAATGRMTAQLSHEINNPIHNIQSLLDSSLKRIDGKPHELISLALEEVNRMAKLTRQMLDFYRGSMVDIEQESVDLQELLNQLLKENEDMLRERKIRAEFDMCSPAANVRGSRDKLKQVFLNLMLNARDAMPHGGEFRVQTKLRDNFLNIDVSDTGVGIAAEHLGKIFDAFFTTKKEVSGVGLGLSVTYGIVQQHDGTIRVASAVGKGTTFTIELPSAGTEP